MAFVAKNINSKSECIRYLRLFKFASFEDVKSFTRQFDKNEADYVHVPIPKKRTKRPSSDSVKVFTILFLFEFQFITYKLKNKGLKPFKFLTQTLHKVPSHNAAPLIQMKTYPIPDCLKKLNHVMYTNTQKTYVNLDENYHQSYNNE